MVNHWYSTAKQNMTERSQLKLHMCMEKPHWVVCVIFHFLES